MFSAYKYNLNNSGWSPEISQQTVLRLDRHYRGQHSIALIARDWGGNWQKTEKATLYSFVLKNRRCHGRVDGIAPEVSAPIIQYHGGWERSGQL